MVMNEVLRNDWPLQSEARKFYGDPLDESNLVIIRPAWPITASWNGNPVKGIRIHRRCAESLDRVLDSIWRASDRSLETIREWGMHLFGGSYVYRNRRGGFGLSMHAYGCAVDFDPARNRLGDPEPNFRNVREVLEAFDSEGWEWGGNLERPDGMHWQAARTK